MVVRALVALGLALLVASGCGTPPPGGQPIDVTTAKTPEDLTALLGELVSRTDPESCVARARIYARLRDLDGSASTILMARGDAADVDLLSQASSEDLKVESGERLARHFLERSRRPPGSSFQEPGAAPARRFALLKIASMFGEYASRDLQAGILEELARSAEELSRMDILRPEIQEELRKQAKAATLQAAIVRAAEEKGEPSPEARRFYEIDLSRHLDEATRSADQGTRERAARGDFGRIFEAYLQALSHYLVAREILVSPTPAQEHALSGMEIIIRSICDLLHREP